MSLLSIKASLSSVISRGRFRAPDVDDARYYEPSPLKQDEVSELLRSELGTMLQEDKLRASEKLERDSLALIRNALYPAS